MGKLSNNEYKNIFDSIATRYDEINNVYAVSRRRDILVTWAKGNCLEVGAGTGEIARELIKKCQVVATDISPNMVVEIKKKLNIETRVCDAEELPFLDASFDTVIASGCIHYLNHPKRFISEAKRVLKPTGRLLIFSPTKIGGIYEFLRTFLRILKFKRMYFDDKNRDFISTRKLWKLLHDGEFKIKEMKKIIIIPFGPLDVVNRFLERLPFKHLGLFIVVNAEKS